MRRVVLSSDRDWRDRVVRILRGRGREPLFTADAHEDVRWLAQGEAALVMVRLEPGLDFGDLVTRARRDDLSFLVCAPEADARQLTSLLSLGATDVWSGELSDADMELRLTVAERWLARNLRTAAAMRSLRHSRSRYRALVQGAMDIIAVLDDEGRIRYVNPALKKLLGYDSHAYVGREIYELVHPDDIALAREAVAEGSTPSVTSRVELRVRHESGEWRTIEAVADNLIGYPSVRGIVVTARDVTERRELEEMLARQAFFDPLTGLANRVLFTDRLEHALAQRPRGSGAPALLFVDLDGFKDINDSYGHDVGDAALVVVGERMDAASREGDTVARLGGDEFTVLLEVLETRGAAEGVAQRLLTALAEPLPVGDLELHVTVSIGIAYSEEGIVPKELVRRADTAMYLAKEAGKNRYLVWKPRHDTERPRA